MKPKKKSAFPKGDKRIDTSASSIGDVQNRPPTASEELDMIAQKLVEHVRERNGKFVVTNKSGNKTLGTHATRGSALAQLRAIEAHKHMGEAIDHKKNTHKDYANIKGLDGSCAETHGGGACAKCGFHMESVQRNVGRFGKLKVSGYKKYSDLVNSGQFEKAKTMSKRHDASTNKNAVKGADENEHRTSVNVKESLDLVEEINIRKVSTNTLRALANAPVTKKKAGGHITMHDKKLASLAKRELLRRKQRGMGESMDYAKRFNDALEHFGVEDVSELDMDTTRDFLKYVDTLDESVISANSQKHLPVSDEIKNRVAQDMQKRKDMKARLMAAAGDEYKAHVAKTREPSAARALFRKDLKKESVNNEEAGSVTDVSPKVVLVPAKVRTIKANKKTQGHSGKKE